MKANATEFTGIKPLMDTTHLTADLAARMDLLAASPTFDLASVGDQEACDIETDIGDVRLIRHEGSCFFRVLSSSVAELEHSDIIRIDGANLGGSLIAVNSINRFCSLAFSKFVKNYADDEFYQAVGPDLAQRSRDTGHLQMDDRGEFMTMWDLVFRVTPPVQQVYRYAEDVARRTPVF